MYKYILELECYTVILRKLKTDNENVHTFNCIYTFIHFVKLYNLNKTLNR